MLFGCSPLKEGFLPLNEEKPPYPVEPGYPPTPAPACAAAAARAGLLADACDRADAKAEAAPPPSEDAWDRAEASVEAAALGLLAAVWAKA